MQVSDVMTTNVVTIPGDTSLVEARRIIDSHGFRRLPVVDRGKLVGIVTKDGLDKAGPSQLTTFSVHELSYLLHKIKVRDVMRKDVLTGTPDMTIEEAVAQGQSRRMGSMVVLEGEKVVGIVTTNDIFYKVLNPILGLGMPGSRIGVRNAYRGSDLEKVIAIINELGVGISTLFTIDLPDSGKHDLVIHLDTEDDTRVIEEIQKIGLVVEERAR